MNEQHIRNAISKHRAEEDEAARLILDLQAEQRVRANILFDLEDALEKEEAQQG